MSQWVISVISKRGTDVRFAPQSDRICDLLGRSLPGTELSTVVDRVCLYYFFMVVVIRYKTTAAACWALTFIVRIFVNDTVTITVWTSFRFHGAHQTELEHNWLKLHTSSQPYSGSLAQVRIDGVVASQQT